MGTLINIAGKRSHNKSVACRLLSTISGLILRVLFNILLYASKWSSLSFFHLLPSCPNLMISCITCRIALSTTLHSVLSYYIVPCLTVLRFILYHTLLVFTESEHSTLQCTNSCNDIQHPSVIKSTFHYTLLHSASRYRAIAI